MRLAKQLVSVMKNENGNTLVRKIMMANIRPTPVVIMAVAAIAVAACGRTTGSVVLSFDHEIAGELLVFDNIRYVSRAGHPYSIATLQYYVSDISLNTPAGNGIDLDVVHYRDARDESTRQLVLESIPSGRYDSLTLKIGLNEQRNVDGGLPNTVTNMNMEWPIPGDIGYHYMKLEGKFEHEGRIRNFAIHTGATQRNKNYVTATIPLGEFYVQREASSLTIIMDLNEWLQNPNTYDFAADGSMIMMNQEAQEVIQANGQTVFEAKVLSPGD